MDGNFCRLTADLLGIHAWLFQFLLAEKPAALATKSFLTGRWDGISNADITRMEPLGRTNCVMGNDRIDELNRWFLVLQKFNRSCML
jgi:hypothetical protein